MGFIPIRQKGVAFDPSRGLPFFYMNDFSIMGLIVDRLNDAVDVITAGGYKIAPDREGKKIVIEDSAQIPEIFHILKKNRIEVHITDLVAQVYQG